LKDVIVEKKLIKKLAKETNNKKIKGLKSDRKNPNEG
jgi:hypothetical protein